MKLSVSIPDDDVAFLDDFVAEAGLASRSAAVQKAIRLLRSSSLGPSYAAAWDEFEGAEWETTSADGLG